MNATLTIYRPWMIARGILSYTVTVDGAESITLKNGESAVLTLAPGSHTIELRHRRVVSHPLVLTLNADEKRELVSVVDAGGSMMDTINSLLGRPCDCMRLLGDEDPEGHYLLAAAKQSVRLSGMDGIFWSARYILIPGIVMVVVKLCMPQGLPLPLRLTFYVGAVIGSFMVFYLLRDRAVVVDGVALKSVVRPTFVSRLAMVFPIILLLSLIGGFIAGVSRNDGGLAAIRDSAMLGLRLSSSFVQACPANCARANPGMTTCAVYCDCMSKGLFRGGSDIDTRKLYLSRESGTPDVEMELKYRALHVSCGAEATR